MGSTNEHKPNFAYALNNYWHTNFPRVQSGEFTFRYVLTSGADLSPAALSRLADGLTARQRFFFSYAFSWCADERPEAARNQVTTNPHSLPWFRVDSPRCDGWRRAASDFAFGDGRTRRTRVERPSAFLRPVLRCALQCQQEHPATSIYTACVIVDRAV